MDRDFIEKNILVNKKYAVQFTRVDEMSAKLNGIEDTKWRLRVFEIQKEANGFGVHGRNLVTNDLCSKVEEIIKKIDKDTDVKKMFPGFVRGHLSIPETIEIYQKTAGDCDEIVDIMSSVQRNLEKLLEKDPTDEWPEEIAVVRNISSTTDSSPVIVVDMIGGVAAIDVPHSFRDRIVKNKIDINGMPCVVAVEPPGTGSPIVRFRRMFNDPFDNQIRKGQE